MDEKQAMQLADFLDGVLKRDTSLTAEVTDHFSIFQKMRDEIRLGGVNDLLIYLDAGAHTEITESYLVYIPFTQIRDILFGDITLVPPLLDTYPMLCGWRLSFAE